MFEIGRTNSTAKATPLSPRASLAFAGYLSWRMNTFHSHSAAGETCAVVVGQNSAFDWSTHHFLVGETCVLVGENTFFRMMQDEFAASCLVNPAIFGSSK